MRRLVTLLLAGAALLASCGGDEGDTAPAGNPRAVLLRVGVLPLTNSAPLFLGIEKGFFTRQSLNIRPQIRSSGTSIVAGVVGGDLQFGSANPVALVSAAAEGQPVQIVLPAAVGGGSAADAWANLLVLADGPIASVRDLKGASIGVNGRLDISELAVRDLLAKENLRQADVDFVPLPFAQMRHALAAGRVDAIAAVEPFLTQARDLGVRELAPFYVRLAPNLPIALYTTTDQYAIDHPDVVERFVTAMRQSLEYANEHPDEVRRIVPTFTSITPAA